MPHTHSKYGPILKKSSIRQPSKPQTLADANKVDTGSIPTAAKSLQKKRRVVLIRKNHGAMAKIKSASHLNDRDVELK